MGMYGAGYIWMLESWNSVDWWKNVTWLGCTEAMMYKVAENYVGTVFLDLRTDNNQTISGLVRLSDHVSLPLVLPKYKFGNRSLCLFM